MGEVFLATRTVAEGLTKRVVIKKIRSEFADQPEFRGMFRDEAEIALRLNHANIVQVFDYGSLPDGSLFLEMEAIDGLDLSKLLDALTARGERVPPVIAAYIAHQVTAGLAYAHNLRDDYGVRLGLVHRDISPHNIMVTYAGTVKVLDFGIARTRAIKGKDPREDDTIQGKIAYMSPEQAMGWPLDQRSDLYSLGVVLHELLTGELVFRLADTVAAITAVRTQPLPPLAVAAPHVPAELTRLIDRALARVSEDRWPSARAMQGALADYLHRADPVVDDEVLSGFIESALPIDARASLLSPNERTTAPVDADAPTRAIVEAPELPTRPRPAPSPPELVEVVLLRAVFRRVPEELLEAERSTRAGDEREADKDAEHPFFAIARGIVFKRGGVLERLNEDGMIAVFGALPDTGDAGTQALRAALSLRESIAEAAPNTGIGVVLASLPLALRRELAPPRVELAPALDDHLAALAGRVIDRHVTVTGDPELTRRLEGSWSFGPPRFLDLPSDLRAALPSPQARGLDQVWLLRGPVQERDHRVTHPPGVRARLYGREFELKALRDRLVGALRTHDSRVALVVGDPGLGKHTLVDRFVAALPRGACTLISGRGHWRHRNTPLGALIDLVRQFLDIGERSDVAHVAGQLARHGLHDTTELASALLSAASALTDAPSPDGIATARRDDTLNPLTASLVRRERLGRLICELIESQARRRPVVLIIERLHFLDVDSLRLLRAWFERPLKLPLLCVLTARHGQRAREFMTLETVATIRLGELNARARREMIVRRFEDPGSADALARAILERAGGNPLFIEETLAALQRQGVIGWNATGRFLVLRQRGVPPELPPSVEALLRARLDALPEAERELLEAAAILGHGFRTAELRALMVSPERVRGDVSGVYTDGYRVDEVRAIMASSRPEAASEATRVVAERVSRSITHLRDLGLLELETVPEREFAAEPRSSSRSRGRPSERLRFNTVSLHEVCKSSLDPALARRLHAAAARIKRARDDYAPKRDDGPIAEHLALAGRHANAIEPALSAARHAGELASNVEAHFYLSLALSALPEDDPRRFPALLRRERILRSWGRRRDQGADLRRLAEYAQRHGSGAQRVHAGIRLLRFYLECGRAHHARQLLGRVASELSQVSAPTYYEAALDEIRAELLAHEGQLARAEALARDALERATPGRPGTTLHVRLLVSIGRYQLADGRLDAAQETFDQALARARALGHRHLEADLLNHLGEVAARRTRYQEAIERFSEAVRLDRQLGDRVATGTKLANLGITYTALGQFRLARRFLSKALELQRATQHAGLVGEVLVNLATVDAALGDVDAARQKLEQAVDVARRHGDPRTELRARSRALRLDVDRLRDPAAATAEQERAALQESARAILQAARDKQLRSPQVRVLHSLSLLAEHDGDPAAAVAYAQEAATLVRAGAASLDGVLSIHQLGRLLVQRGDAEAGEALLAEAAALTKRRLADLRKPALRRGYLALPEVREVLGYEADP